MSRVGRLAHNLYAGKVSYDFVGRRRRWYAISAGILLVAIGGLLFRGLNLGIEFEGGAEYQVPSTATCSVDDARQATRGVIGTDPIVTQVGNGAIRVQTESLSTTQSNVVLGELAKSCDVATGDIKVQLVGPTWGGEITRKALQGLVVFLLLVSVFLSVYFEWRMAVAALIALAHDLVITIGIYALIGFEVTPATVIGLLTILGYSLYDTVVVFDKVKENTRGVAGQSRVTYSDAANLALNQTLVRSINTSVVALLPVAGILFVGAGLLGAGTLKDLALALFIGMLAGTYSSIFVATPILAQLKEQQPEMQALARRVSQRTAGTGRRTGSRGGAGNGDDLDVPADEAGSGGDGATAPGDEPVVTTGARSGAKAPVVVRPATSGGRQQPRKQPKSKRGH